MVWKVKRGHYDLFFIYANKLANFFLYPYLSMRKHEEFQMNINQISSNNFGARMVEKDYHFEKIEEDLYCNHGIGAEDIINFHEELKKLPIGDVLIDEYVKHADKDYVFGTIYPPCGHKKPFVVETNDSENLLKYMLSKIKQTFREKSNNQDCPICNQ